MVRMSQALHLPGLVAIRFESPLLYLVVYENASFNSVD